MKLLTQVILIAVLAGAGNLATAKTVNVKNFGAKGNGRADDSKAIQEAINSGANEILVPAGTYKLNSHLELKSGQFLNAPNAVFDSDSLRRIIIHGSVEGSSNLHTGAVSGSNSIKVSKKSMFSVNDWVVVQDTPMIYNNASKNTPQELFQVKAVNRSPSNHDVITLSGTLAFDYTLGNRAKAKASRVTPIQNVKVDVGELRAIRFDIEIARLCSIKAKATEITVLNYGTGAITVACDQMTADITMDYGYKTGGTPLGLKVVGWSNSKFNIFSYGGEDDAVRLFGCANMDTTASIDSSGDRSIWLYRCTGRVSPNVSNCPTVATGNMENILIDYCRDLVVDSPRLTGWRRGDGIELRSRSLNVELRNVYVVSENAVDTRNALNFHSNGGEFEVAIRGGYVQGGAWEGLILREQVDSAIIEGLTIVPFPGDPRFVPVRIGENMYGWGNQHNIILRDSTFVSEGAMAISANDEDGKGNRIKNMLIEDVEVGYVSNGLSKIIRVADSNNTTIRRIKFAQSESGDEFWYTNNSNLSVNEKSFTLSGSFNVDSIYSQRHALDYEMNYGSAANEPTISLAQYRHAFITLDRNNYTPVFTRPNSDQTGQLRFNNLADYEVNWAGINGGIRIRGDFQPWPFDVSIIEYSYDEEADTLTILDPGPAPFVPDLDSGPPLDQDPSPDLDPTLIPDDVVKLLFINSGGEAASPDFEADQNFDGGTSYRDIIAITAEDDIPQEVLQTQRYGDFQYVIGDLYPNSIYFVDLHFAEIYHASPGKRVFDVSINGDQVLDDYDIVAEAGSENLQLSEFFPVQSTVDGFMTITFSTVIDNAAVNGISIWLDLEALLDTDDDGIPDLDDLDDDNDNTPDNLDAFPLDASEQADTDGDGIGNNIDIDDDNDGVNDESDALPLNPDEASDTDGDGIGNNADLDDDNDSIPDLWDPSPLLADTPGSPEVVLAINVGGESAGSGFVKDDHFSGGNLYGITNSIDQTASVPAEVYQTVRYGNFEYRISGLNPGFGYVVDLHLAEVYYNESGKRHFNVTVNDKPVLENYDIVATTGARYQAITESIPAYADSSGTMVIRFDSVVSDAAINGLTIWQDGGYQP